RVVTFILPAPFLKFTRFCRSFTNQGKSHLFRQNLGMTSAPFLLSQPFVGELSARRFRWAVPAHRKLTTHLSAGLYTVGGSFGSPAWILRLDAIEMAGFGIRQQYPTRRKHTLYKTRMIFGPCRGVG